MSLSVGATRRSFVKASPERALKALTVFYDTVNGVKGDLHV
jgi:hypothetical protein